MSMDEQIEAGFAIEESNYSDLQKLKEDADA